jgi:hypothetical protein
MTINELAEKCKQREINCTDCPYNEPCEKLTDELQDISPIGLVDMVKDNQIIW